MTDDPSALPPGVSVDVGWEPRTECPSCFSRGVRTFFHVDDIPVHSTLRMQTRAEAIDSPRGNLTLAFCPACGFVFNTRFDPHAQAYSERCEESQGFSPTFNTFARSVAAQLIEKHDLRGKTVLEIGCGKAEFLVLLCQLGGNRGIGIDPAYRPDRTPPEVADRVTFIQDLYGPKYAHLAADFVACRHTLEHIGPAGRFIREIRATLADRRDTIAWFELPDAYRVFREGAFWDIYYEHCAYFSLGSLARLFRHAGFEVTALESVYDNQYLLLTARPAPGPTTRALPGENDLPTMTQAVEQFPRVCAEGLSRWRRFVTEAANRREKVVIWGSLSKGVSFLTTLKVVDEVEYVVDINPHRQGYYMPGTGQLIVGPEHLSKYRPDHVIAMNPIYRSEIQADLDRLGVKADLRTV